MDGRVVQGDATGREPGDPPLRHAGDRHGDHRADGLATGGRAAPSRPLGERAGSLIDDKPLRVNGTITSAIPRKRGRDYQVTYRVGDRDYSTATLGLERVAHPAVGVSAPLEVAAGDPATARVVWATPTRTRTCPPPACSPHWAPRPPC